MDSENDMTPDAAYAAGQKQYHEQAAERFVRGSRPPKNLEPKLKSAWNRGYLDARAAAKEDRNA